MGTKLNSNPILLLDDIFDKLDDNRVKQIINLVNEEKFNQISGKKVITIDCLNKKIY